MTTSEPRLRRILVLANETLSGGELRGQLTKMDREQDSEVFLICPALATRAQFFVSDRSGAIRAAQARLEQTLAALNANEVAATGQIGDSDPLLALEDGLRQFKADEIVIATHPPERSNWLEKKVVDKARERFDLPITHIIVDLTAAALATPHVA